jgi:peptidyl-prolyl cis-trans isomerase SurA
MRATAVFFLLASVLQAGIIIDGIAVVVNRHPVKISDIERESRLTDFLNKAEPALTPAERKASMERLIDQQLIRAELSSGSYHRATDDDAERLLAQIRHERYLDSADRLKQGLAHYQLTEGELRAHLLWQLTVLTFINDRFRSGVSVASEEIQSYYEQHRSSFPGSLDDATSGAIRTLLEGEQINQQFEDWLAEARKGAVIDYKKEAIP